VALAALRSAVAEEDTIPYDEPPGWHVPARLALGSALLEAGKPGEAEATFREELRRNPANGWSLRGLVQAIEAQQRDASAERAQLQQAWANADIELTAAHL
jgi:predicted Zn-dependent protease